MAVSNLQETLLMYTKYKSMLTKQINDVEFNLLAATRKVLDLQSKYNDKQQAYYYYYNQDGMEEYHDEYTYLCEQMEKEYEFSLQNINSWNMELEAQKDNYETRYNEITAHENSFRALLKSNIKIDFTYGGTQQGG